MISLSFFSFCLKLQIFLLCVGTLYATNTSKLSLEEQDNFKEANNFYSQGNFLKAVKKYQTLIDNPQIQDGNLYYNYANSLYQINRIGEAILSYEKSLLIIPTDKDVQKNLSFIRSKFLKSSQNTPFFAFSLLKSIILKTSLNFKNYLGLFFWITFFIFLSFLFFLKKDNRIFLVYFIIISFISFFIIFTSSLYQSYHIYNNQEAICLINSLSIYSGPGKQYKILSKINQGTKIIVLSESKGWSKIKLFNNDYTTGFISSNKIAYIRLK